MALVPKANMAETSPPWLVNKDVTKWGVLVDGSTVSGKAFDAAVSFLCYHVAPIKSRNWDPATILCQILLDLLFAGS